MASSMVVITAPEVWAEQIDKGSFVGAFCLLIFDHLLTLADEVEYVWTLPRTDVFRWLFSLLRYGVFTAQFLRRFKDVVDSRVPITVGLCKVWYLIEVVAMEVAIMSVEGILMIRVYRLYGRERTMAKFFGMLITLESIIMIIGCMMTLPGVYFSPLCIETVSPLTMGFFVAGVLFNHIIVLGFTLYECFRRQRSRLADPQVTDLLLWDGTLTFIALLGVTITNVIIYAAVDRSLSSIGSPWIVVSMSVAGCRIIINLRRLAAKAQRQAQLSTIELTTNVFRVGATIEIY